MFFGGIMIKKSFNAALLCALVAPCVGQAYGWLPNPLSYFGNAKEPSETSKRQVNIDSDWVDFSGNTFLKTEAVDEKALQRLKVQEIFSIYGYSVSLDGVEKIIKESRFEDARIEPSNFKAFVESLDYLLHDQSFNSFEDTKNYLRKEMQDVNNAFYDKKDNNFENLYSMLQYFVNNARSVALNTGFNYIVDQIDNLGATLNFEVYENNDSYEEMQNIAAIETQHAEWKIERALLETQLNAVSERDHFEILGPFSEDKAFQKSKQNVKKQDSSFFGSVYKTATSFLPSFGW